MIGLGISAFLDTIRAEQEEDKMSNDGLIEALELLIEELDDPGRVHPVFKKDDFSQLWEPDKTDLAINLSRVCKEQVRAALAKAKGGC
jgi:hypothetical protein